MTWLIIGMLCIALSGVPGLLYDRRSDGGERPAAVLVVAGCLACLAGIVGALLHGGAELQLAWAVPAGRFALRIDALAAAFLLPLLLVVATGAVYGLGYWPQREHPDNGRKLRLNYGLISAAMILLLCARNGVLFLVGWEVMALAGFFLITAEDRRAEVRRAGYIYLIATHTGTLALFGLFALLGHATGSALWPAAGALPAAGSTALFLLGLFGFGMKAGLMPLHIWLPGAHAAAPSHASALLSGVMIKTGIYGLVRLTSLFAVIPPWWGWTLLLTGAVSGILGVALALAQHDIKRLLAYHSVENIGIIAMGLGLALLGRSFGQPQLVLLGLAGCLLHVANHGLFKSLLFLSAGSVIHATGSRDLDHFGGLLKLQRWTGLFFLGGAVAISGLPPFNGFISEWLIYLGAFHAVGHPGRGLYLALLAAPALALIGGLALACFVKVFGVTFLGAPRTPRSATGPRSAGLDAGADGPAAGGLRLDRPAAGKRGAAAGRRGRQLGRHRPAAFGRPPGAAVPGRAGRLGAAAAPGRLRPVAAPAPRRHLRDGRNLGLRLPLPDAAHAVHRQLLRRHPGGPVPLRTVERAPRRGGGRASSPAPRALPATPRTWFSTAP